MLVGISDLKRNEDGKDLDTGKSVCKTEMKYCGKNTNLQNHLRHHPDLFCKTNAAGDGACLKVSIHKKVYFICTYYLVTD